MKQKEYVPFFLTPVAGGFPSPAEEFMEHTLDLNEYLIKHPASTFFVKVFGDSMKGRGVFSGDMLVVDRSLKPKDGALVVAALDGEFTVKSLKKMKGGVVLCPANPKYSSIRITKDMDFVMWGVVTHVIKHFV